MDTYVLEYSKKQNQYHVQTISERNKRNNNEDWEIIDIIRNLILKPRWRK
jgi:hypothetical protein